VQVSPQAASEHYLDSLADSVMAMAATLANTPSAQASGSFPWPAAYRAKVVCNGRDGSAEREALTSFALIFGGPIAWRAVSDALIT